MKIVICPECGAEVKIPVDGVHVEKIRVCLDCDRKLAREAQRIAALASKKPGPITMESAAAELPRLIRQTRKKTNAA